MDRRYHVIYMSKTRKKTYTDEHYNSNDGMLTYVWGPAIWHFLHTMSFNYPTHPTDLDKTHYSKFVKGLQYVLPCKYCRTNFKTYLKNHPLDKEHLANRYVFSKYIYTLHEHINKMLGKISGLTYEAVRDRYENFRSRCLVEKQEEISHIEKGCTEPLLGKKSKCVLRIVPLDDPSPPFSINPKCVPKKLTRKNKSRKRTSFRPQ